MKSSNVIENWVDFQSETLAAALTLVNVWRLPGNYFRRDELCLEVDKYILFYTTAYKCIILETRRFPHDCHVTPKAFR